jgi:hypothetical protein
LNLTAIGIGEPGTAISFSASSVDLSRGQTKQLLLVGAGLTAGTAVTVSGGGVTIDSVVFQTGNIFVNISASTSAATGPRNVIVTNSNLDTSVLSGGLFIR